MKTILPVLERELRAVARRRETYLTRTLAGGAAVAFALAMLVAGFARALSPAAAGQTFLLWMTVIGYAGAVLYGAMTTCDCVSRERREGTLGLLFLTHLNGFDVVLGKFVPRFGHMMFCVLGALPSLALVFLLGGVTAGEVFRAALGVVNALFLFGALGMLISTPGSRERPIFFAAFGLTLLLGAGLPAAGVAWCHWRHGVSLPTVWLIQGPAGALLAWASPAPTTLASSGAAAAWCFGLNQLLAWGLLLSAGVWLGSCVRESRAIPSPLWRRLTQPVRFGRMARRPPGQSDADTWRVQHPVFGKEQRANAKRTSPGFRIGLLVAGLATLLVAYPEGWLIPAGWTGGRGFPGVWMSPPIFPATVALLHLLLLFAVTVEACQALSYEKRTGNLELLLVTPAGEEEIVRDQLLALKRRYAGPTLLVLGYQWLLGITALVQLQPAEQVTLLVLLALPTAGLAVALYALAWVGLWRGLRAPRVSRAIRESLVVVLVLPWVLPMAVVAGLALLQGVFGLGIETASWVGATVCAGVFAATVVGAVGGAMYSLGERLREVAAAPLGRGQD